MSATIASVTQVSKKFQIMVHVPVNHRITYHQDVISEHPFGSPEIQTQFEAYTADYENGVKDQWPDWHQKDTTRTATFTLEQKPTPGEFICHVQIDIVNAIARTDVAIESDKDGAELTAEQQAAADSAADAWLTARNFVPLT